MKLFSMMVALLLGSVSAYAEEVWLVIGASDSSPADIVTTGKRLGNGSGLIVNSRDCGDKKNVFAWVPKVETSEGAAKKWLAAARPQISGVYIKKCTVRPGSLLAFRQTAIDMSIADIPATAVNWEDADRVSTIHQLKENRHVIISRYYNGDIEDPLEGRSGRVILVGDGGTCHRLESPCVAPEMFSADGKALAFQCTEEQAGDELLHRVVVYSLKGAKLKQVTHCRNPRLLSDRAVRCEKESVGPDGHLKLLRVEEPLEGLKADELLKLTK